MKQVLLITVRNCYPYKEEEVSRFETIEGINVYEKCILPQKDFLQTIVEKAGKGSGLNQKKAIGFLFADKKASWTKEELFKVYMDNGIPLLRKKYGELVFYVLPCTGSTYMQGDDDVLLFKQKYTSSVIDLICEVEAIERKDIYAIIHSDDTGVGGGYEAGSVKVGQLSNGAPLSDIVDYGHLYLFHHTAGEEMYDKIVSQVCSGAAELELGKIEDYFPLNKQGWWSILADLNTKEY